MISSIIAIDVWFENLMLAVRTPVLLRIFDTITFFGNTTTILGIALIVGAYLALSDRPLRPYLAGLSVTLIGALSCGYALKTLVARARPEGLIPSIIETTYSFPSGHAVAAMALYGFIAFLLVHHYREHARKIITGAALIILVIGFSRLYLGVHFPSDVIGGFVLGGIWLSIGIWIVRTLQSRTDFPKP